MPVSWGSVAITEIVWTIGGIIGLIISWDNMRDAREYIRSVDVLNGNNIADHAILASLAFGHYRDEVFRVLKFALIIGAGLALMAAPPSNHHDPVGVPQIITAACLYGLEITMIAASTLDRRQRELVANMRAAED